MISSKLKVLKHISTKNKHKRVHAEHIVQEGKDNKIHPTSKYWTAIQVMNNLSNIYKSRQNAHSKRVSVCAILFRIWHKIWQTFLHEQKYTKLVPSTHYHIRQFWTRQQSRTHRTKIHNRRYLQNVHTNMENDMTVKCTVQKK